MEVADLARQALPGRSFADCRPLAGDCFREPVVWNGADTIGTARGAPICLRFRLDQAALFFVDFAD